MIYDPVSANRTATRAALYALGFRRTETVSTLEAFVEVDPESAARHRAVRGAGRGRGTVHHHPAAAPGRGGLQSLYRHHRHRLGKEHQPDQPRGHPAAPTICCCGPFRPRCWASASRPISSGARALSSPPIMSAPTAARTTAARLRCRTVRAAQFAEDEGQGQAAGRCHRQAGWMPN